MVSRLGLSTASTHPLFSQKNLKLQKNLRGVGHYIIGHGWVEWVLRLQFSGPHIMQYANSSLGLPTSQVVWLLLLWQFHRLYFDILTIYIFNLAICKLIIITRVLIKISQVFVLDYKIRLSKKFDINIIGISVEQEMDYPKLYSQLPKQPIKWTISDIKIWLQFIGLSSLYDKFKELSIDGSCLSSLTQEDLRQQLCIKSGITIKKITSWITKGLKEYQQFLKSPMAGASQIDYAQIKQISQKQKNRQLFPLMEEPKQLIKQSSIKSVPTQSNKIAINSINKAVSYNETNKQSNDVLEDEQQNNRKQFQLVIEQYDGPQNSFYSVKEQGAKIGRHSTNQILILDQSISRFHAQIKFNDGKFYLRDIGSTTGTFIKIMDKLQIKSDMIIQMGSNQFQTHIVEGVLNLQLIEGPSHLQVIEIPKNSKITIGRKQSNSINFPDDQHLSNVHVSIYSIENKYFIQDMKTTNGTWQRLSPEGETSQYFQLSNNIVFKFGSNQTYTCRIRTAMISQKTSPNACIICFQNDKDCVYMPCKHNTACIRCSKNLRDCPICRNKIQDYVRIYKS